LELDLLRNFGVTSKERWGWKGWPDAAAQWISCTY
jgi:hypothetical protein